MNLNKLIRTGFSSMLAVIYVAILCAALLYPFDFSSITAENTMYLQSDGIHFGASGMLRSAAPTTALYERLRRSHGLTLEVWLNSASADQHGPARIVSYSLDPWRRNFTLGQEGTSLSMRLRTTGTDENGINPNLEVADVLLPRKLQHIVVTYDFRLQQLYVDGQLRAAVAVPQGDFRNWNPSCFLVFGNEATGARAWRGVIAYVAIYDRPLSQGAIGARYRAGLALREREEGSGRLIAYDFLRGMQGVESNATTRNILAMPPLTKPRYVHTQSRVIFSFFQGADGKFRLVLEAPASDLVRNVVLFLPFGFFVYAGLNKEVQFRASAVAATMFVGVFVSAGFEGLQAFLVDRTSSVFDVAANTVGVLGGAMILYRRPPADLP